MQVETILKIKNLIKCRTILKRLLHIIKGKAGNDFSWKKRRIFIVFQQERIKSFCLRQIQQIWIDDWFLHAISRAAITIKQKLFSFFCFIVSRIFFFRVQLKNVFSFDHWKLSAFAAVQSIIMHLNAVCIKSRNYFYLNILVPRFACILSNSNAFLMDKRIELMKYFAESSARVPRNSNIAQLFIFKFGISRAKIYTCRLGRQLNWKFVFEERNFWGIRLRLRSAALDKKLSLNFVILRFTRASLPTALYWCNININKFIAFKTKAISRRSRDKIPNWLENFSFSP